METTTLGPGVRRADGDRGPSARAGKRALLGLRLAVYAGGAIPLLLLIADVSRGRLVEPVEAITLRTGWWALAFLMITLAVTPLRRLTGYNRIAPLRRPLGLFAFGYATLHVLTYFGLDLFFDLSFIAEDILERPYITVGFTAWLLLLPLAITSTRGWIRRLGARWVRLHRAVYLAAALGVLHFLWLVKADAREPLIFGAILLILLALRLPVLRPGRRSSVR